MKSPDEIKKALDYCASSDNNCCAPCPYDDFEPCKTVKLMRDALAYVRQLEAAQPKWISVEERLPDQPGQVLICIHDYVGIAWYNDYCFEFGNGMKFAVDYPNTYWMPLPEPPKEADAT